MMFHKGPLPIYGTRSMERESAEEAFDWQAMVGSPIDG
jgi:hypothetical protein